jgi:hypothetical protein
VSQARNSALIAAGQPIPQAQKIWALLDTGASCTCVDPSVLQALQLQPTGRTSVNTPSTGTNLHDANQYDVSFIIPGTSSKHVPFVVHTLSVVEVQLLASQGFHALIGRDVLASCLLTYDGAKGEFTLAF